MNELNQLKKLLGKFSDPVRAVSIKKFFKNSQQDIFLGVNAAQVRKIAKEFYQLGFPDIQELMASNVHEERSVANAILCLKFNKGDEVQKTKVFDFYIKNRKKLRDWDGVDDSAPYIAGAYLLNRDKEILYKLTQSKRIWDRRIAIVSTLYFIRKGHLADTLKISKILLHDQEDLINKAVGWALREVGKKDVSALKKFLQQHHSNMPRITLRYAIERFPADERKTYLLKSRGEKI